MWYNPIVTAILRSPLHGFMSSNILLLTYTGRKSQKRFTLPISYIYDDDRLLTISRADRTWWRNLQGGATVTLRLEGKSVEGTAKAIADNPADVAANLRAFLQHVPKSWVKGYGVSLDSNGEMNMESIQRAAQGKVMVEIRLTKA
jgi:hypothetical protein